MRSTPIVPLLLGLAATVAHGQQTTARIVKYHANDIVNVRARMRYTTLIELPTTEKILEVATGDKDFWIIDAVGNYCFLHPAKEGIHSNLNLITDKGSVYSFTLDDVESGDPDLKVVIEPSDPSSLATANGAGKLVSASEVDAARAQVQVAHAHAAAAVEEFRADYPTQALKFDYSFRSEKPFEVSAIYHDGKFTYIKSSASEKFTIYKLKDGKPDLITFQLKDGTSRLQAELRKAQSEAAELREQKAQLEQRLNQQGADLDRGAAERTELDKKLAATEASLQSLENKLDLTAEQNNQETAQFVEQQTHITELSASLRERDQKVTQDEQLLEHDRDIRNLMGARDLYIAEIYDVAKNGDTQKPFGRFFYTKGKSLIFYAYDLDQQPGVKRASTFQAWGRIGSDTKQDRNLGIFYQDEINKQRWILKSNDAKTLSQIDAVFVTVEPNGQSAKPSGKPLLFTYLRMTPNHP